MCCDLLVFDLDNIDHLCRSSIVVVVVVGGGVVVVVITIGD